MTPAEWFWLYGVHVFPVSGKRPAVPKGTSWKDYRCSRSEAARLRNYGVPLSDQLAVLDTDDRDDERWVLQQIAAGAIPETPFLVETARGVHRYYRLAGPLPKFLHCDGHTIEFKNEGQYVVGPGSQHPSGAIYRARDWSWRWEELPLFPADFVFDDRAAAPHNDQPASTHGSSVDGFEFPEAVHVKERHDQLFRLSRSCKGSGLDREGTREIVHLANENRCHPPLTEDKQFEAWFARAWDLSDRPFEIPDHPLEPHAPTAEYDLDAPEGSI